MSRRREPGEFIELYAALRRSIANLAAQAYAEVEMGTTQAKFLRHIGASGPVSQAALARATLTDPGLTGRVLQTLIERGLVVRERSEKDRREYVVELTAAGKRAQRRVEAARRRLGERVTNALVARDIDDFERVVKKLTAAFPPAGDRERE